MNDYRTNRLESIHLANCQLWQAWYYAKVPEVHHERYEYVSGNQVLCNHLSVNLAKLMVKHMRNFILCELKYVEPFDKVLDPLFGKPEDLKDLVDVMLVYGSYTLLVEDYITSSTDYNIHVVPPTATSRREDGALMLYLTDRKVVIQEQEDGNYYVSWYNYEDAMEGDQVVTYCPYITQTNDTDPQYPLGKSMYADSLDALKSVDMAYTEAYNAVEAGRNLIVVDEAALEHDTVPYKDSEGVTKVKRVSYLSKQNRQFRIIKRPDGLTTDPVKHIQGDLKVDEFEKLINMHIQVAAKGSGFDNGYFRYDASSGITATAIITSKSDLYTSIRTHQRRLVSNLCEFYNSIFQPISIDQGTKELTPDAFDFGDSIVIDEEASKQEGLALYAAGAITKEWLLKSYYNYSDEEIQEAIPKLPMFTLEQGG